MDLNDLMRANSPISETACESRQCGTPNITHTRRIVPRHIHGIGHFFSKESPGEPSDLSHLTISSRYHIFVNHGLVWQLNLHPKLF